MLRVCKLHLLAGVQVDNGPRPQFDAALVGAVDQLLRRYHFSERSAVRRVLRFHKHREHGADHRRRDLRVRVASKLFQALQHGGQQRNAPPLADALAAHDVQHVPPPGRLAVGFHPLPRQPRRVHGAVAAQRMPVAYPVGRHHAVRVGLHALHDVLHLVALHRAGHQPVKAVRAAYPVCLDQPHTQVIRLSRLMLHRQQGDGVAVHQVAQKGKLLELVEVVHPLRVAHRRVRPQCELPHDLRLQLLRRRLVQPQIVAVKLRRGHQSTRHHVCAHGFQRRRGRWDAHVSVSAPLPQNVDVVLDVLLGAATLVHPAPHALFRQVGSVVAIPAVDHAQRGSRRRPLCRADGSHGHDRPVKDVRFLHALPPHTSRATAR